MINILLTSCKEKEPFPIPNLPVNILLNLDLPSYQPLTVPGGWVYVNGGSRGIVVYRNFDEFIALDRHSTYNSEDECAIVNVDSINYFQLHDSCSTSIYSILDGTVINGPAKWGLKRYNTSWDGQYAVHIYN
ncbi:MAG: hypothetical protein ACWA41_01885 [Putridiphycobacter sp.]